jgi:hypothetical protein
MPEQEDLRRDGFIEASRKKGHIRATLGTDTLDSDYDAVNYVTPQGNMGYTAATIQGNTICFFCSVTARGLVATFPDPGIGSAPELTLGRTKMRFAKVKATLKELLEEHKTALRGESVLMSRPQVERELDTLPQKIIDLLKDLAMQQEGK